MLKTNREETQVRLNEASSLEIIYLFYPYLIESQIQSLNFYQNLQIKVPLLYSETLVLFEVTISKWLSINSLRYYRENNFFYSELK